MYFTWEDVYQRIEGLGIQGKRVWGIPRGGAVVAGLAGRMGAVPVASPELAHFAVDDIVDSGQTARWVWQRYGLQTVALVDRRWQEVDGWVHFPWEEPPDQEIAHNVTRIIEYLGDQPQREGLRDTPRRVVASWGELYRGYQLKPETLLRWFEDDTDEMVICKGIQFYSTCEHHLLPFFGHATIGYLPQGKVIGVSKLARVVDAYARRLQIQERLGRQIGELLQPHSLGVAVHLDAQHLCMMARGVSQQESTLVTNYLSGPFRDKPEARAEFFAAIR